MDAKQLQIQTEYRLFQRQAEILTLLRSLDINPPGTTLAKLKNATHKIILKEDLYTVTTV